METNPYAAPNAPLVHEETVPVANPALWNPNAAGLWSLLLSPVFGSILLMKNWQAMGDERQVRSSLTWLLASLVILLVQIYVPFLALFYIIVWYLNFQRKQTDYVQAHWGTSYPRKGWGLPLLLGVLSLFAFGGLLAFLDLA